MIPSITNEHAHCPHCVTHQELLLGPVATLYSREVSKLQNEYQCRKRLHRQGLSPRTPDLLLGAGKVNGLDTANLLLHRAGNSGLGHSRGSDHAGSSDEATALDGGRGQLAGHWRPQGLGKAARRHVGAERGEIRDILESGGNSGRSRSSRNKAYMAIRAIVKYSLVCYLVLHNSLASAI